MSTQSGFRALSLALIVFAPAAMAAQVKVGFLSDDQFAIVPREIAEGTLPVEGALAALAAGPTEQERAAGITSALPAGTRIVRVVVDGEAVTVDFSFDLLSAGVTDSWYDAVFRQVFSTLEPLKLSRKIHLTVGGAPLADYLPPLALVPPAPSKKTALAAPRLLTDTGSALAGKVIALSPGHGYRFTGTTWNYERPEYCPPLNNEDLHNVELVAHLQRYLAQDGAVPKAYRCLDKLYGNYATNRPWWTMSAGYWLQNLGYPCEVYASRTGNCTLPSGGSGSDNSLNDCLYSRPLAADYDNADIYISMHTDGNTGYCVGAGCPSGTLAFYDDTGPHEPWGAESQTLAGDVQNSVVDVVRAHYEDATWSGRGGPSQGAYIEIRYTQRPAILLELGYHDTCDRDALYLQDEWFKSAAMWGVYKGVCDYFGTTPTYPFYSAEYVSDTIPSEMLPGESYEVNVTMRNRGVLWNTARQFRLGAVDDSDPFTTTLRVSPPFDIVTAQTCTFVLTLTAPKTPGTYTTDWRMVRDSVGWFGPTHSESILVRRLFARGDFNSDHDVDLEDFGHFQSCLSGVGVVQSDPTCQNCNFDHDTDVDAADLAVFAACFKGPSASVDPYCGG